MMNQMKMMMSTAVAKQAIEGEDKKAKQRTMIEGFGLAVVCLIFAALNLARLGSVGNIQTLTEDSDPYWDEDVVAYDVQCLRGYLEMDEDNVASWGAYVLVGYAAPDQCDQDEDCAKLGTQWSALYLFNGLLYLCLMGNMICVGIGTWKAMARMLGAACALPCWCFNFAMLMVTATYRYRGYGKACALNETG